MKKSHIVIGLGYGDEGKGSWVDYLVRKHNLKFVVRFNGGGQAAHHVETPEGLMHCFAHFGSGTLVPGTITCLSKYIAVNPFSLEIEAKTLSEKGIGNPFDKILIDENCPIVTPFNKLLNRIQELSRKENKHGSCGCGVGATHKDVEIFGDKCLYMRDLRNLGQTYVKLVYLWRQKIKEVESLVSSESLELFNQLREIFFQIPTLTREYFELAKHFQIVSTEKVLEIISQNNVVFEGAQGVLLDQTFGFFPHVTKSNTTVDNALKLLEESGFDGEIIKTGLLRGYSTRHGAGPFVTEDIDLNLIEKHNHTNEWQGKFRQGWFDCVSAKYALEVVNGVDILGITNLDKMNGIETILVCVSYDDNLDCLKLKSDLLLFNKCQPTYKSVPGWAQCEFVLDVEHYLGYIGENLNQKIGGISISPTFEGKCELIPF